MKIAPAVLTTVLIALSVLAVPAYSVELKPATASAFDQYVASTESKWVERKTGANFIQIAATPEQEKRLKAGEVVVRPAMEPNGELAVNGGIVHHWIGGFFLPGVSLQQVVRSAQDYSHHKVNFAPDIQDSVIRSHNTPNDFQIYMRIVKSKMMVTDVLNTEHTIHWSFPVDKRAYCRSATTKIAEVVDAGKPTEHELPVGNDRGIVWRMNSYWFLEERDGGVYVENDSITLSRDLPFILSKMLGPILHNVPAETQKSSLEKCKRAVLATPAQSGARASN